MDRTSARWRANKEGTTVSRRLATLFVLVVTAVSAFASVAQAARPVWP